MANSDKDANRSHAGGNPTEPAQPVSQTQVGAEGVKAMLSKALQPGPEKLTLETKLGMFTIVILVFTFGFLVYRKVDLHQQRLTQASIGPQSEQALQQMLTPGAESLPQPVSGGDVPFNDVSPDRFTAGDEFFAASGGRTELMPASEADPAFAAEPEPGLQPSTADTMVDVPMNTASDNPFGEQISAMEPIAAEPVAAEPVAAEPVAAEPIAAEPVAIDAVTLSAADSFPPVESFDPPATSTNKTEFDFPELSEPPAPSTAISFASEAEIPPAADVPPNLSFDAEPVIAASTPASIELESSPAEPPMLIAMADPAPQHQLADESNSSTAPAFDGRFAPEPSFGELDPGFSDSTSRPKAPIPTAEPDATIPAFDALEVPSEQPAWSTDSGSTNRTADTAPAASPFDTTTFDPPPAEAAPQFSAVQTPRPASRTRVSPAVATSTDGRFSLAAFNYQNNVAPPIDDGNTYDVLVVREGDNYSTISKRVYGTIRYFSALAIFNQHRIPDPRKMRPGMKILTPPAEILEERFPQLFPEIQRAEVKPAGYLIQEDGSPAYRVGGRETLSEISQRFLGRSSRWPEIHQLNRSILKDPNKLRPGLVLALPADAVEVNVAP